MNHPTERIIHTTAFVTPVVEHWLERAYLHRCKQICLTFFPVFHAVILNFTVIVKVNLKNRLKNRPFVSVPKRLENCLKAVHIYFYFFVFCFLFCCCCCCYFLRGLLGSLFFVAFCLFSCFFLIKNISDNDVTNNTYGLSASFNK